jgi:phospholipid/cholesterol/gamma-HCH transport system substrate-binding protein
VTTGTIPHPPTPRRREHDREVWVGLFVLLGVFAALALLFTLTDASTFRGRYVVKTVVADAAGVRKGDPVQMRGVNIGRIKGFRIFDSGVEVALEIEGAYEVPADSQVELTSSGLFGNMAARIIPGTSHLAVAHGGTLPSTEKAAGAADRLTDITTQAQRTLVQVQKLLSDQTVQNVEQSTASLNQMLAELRDLTAEQRDEVRGLTRSLRRSAAGLEKAVAGPELARSIERLDRVTAQMEHTMTALDRSSRSLEVVMGRLERGEGTLGKLSRDESLYRNASEAVSNLNRTATELRTLVQDVKANPRRYIHLEIF